MNRERIERHQVWLYLVAILTGLAAGSAAPALAPLFEAILWPTLGALLYTTFTQVPLTHLPDAFRDRRFMSALLTGNFLLAPLAISGLIVFLPDDPAIRLGVLLVLLAPCTDWFITFSHLGGGDVRRAIAATPVLLLIQIVLLPLYLLLFMGDAFFEILAADRIATVFMTLIVLPLAAAWLTERWAERRAGRKRFVAHLGLLPVPLLALAVFLIAAAQVHTVRDALPVLGHVFGVFVAFLFVAAAIGIAAASWFALPYAAARTVVFSLGTRNSFVVLPLALALTSPWQAAAVVIVFQSLVELFGMVAYLWAVPRLIPATAPEGSSRP